MPLYHHLRAYALASMRKVTDKHKPLFRPDLQYPGIPGRITFSTRIHKMP